MITFSAKSVILALCDEASHPKIRKFDVFIRVYQTVSTRQVPAVEARRIFIACIILHVRPVDIFVLSKIGQATRHVCCHGG